MTPQSLNVDQTLSYAQRSGGGYRVLLWTTDQVQPAQDAHLRLRNRKRTVRVPLQVTAEAAGSRLEARLGTSEIGPGTWRLAVVDGEEQPVLCEARLVIGRDQPVALLTGPEPTTAMGPPRPRRRAASSGRGVSPVRRVRSIAGRARRRLQG